MGNNFRQRVSSLSQMELRQKPLKTSFNPSRNRNPPQNGALQQENSEEGGTNINGSPPYWLNPLYLAAILQQNNKVIHLFCPLHCDSQCE